ncbi:MAG: amidohydrolase [Chitinophagales bacterium]|nr:amidohydrolase [Chitinophagales bacterium]
MHDLKVTLIQSDLAWEDKARNMGIFSQLINACESTDLIILPEMFTTGFSMQAEKLAEKMDGTTMEWMYRTAQKKNCIVAGSLIIEDNKKYYNRLVWMRQDGSFEVYDKRHLFSLGDEHNHYTGGTKKIIVELKGWRIYPLICYDLRFPAWSRNTDNYDLLMYVANWPERRIYAWKQLLIARAIENQSYVVGVNRIGTDGNNLYHSGNSAVINAMGEVIWESVNERAVLTTTLSKAELDETRRKLPFLDDKDSFEIRN